MSLSTLDHCSIRTTRFAETRDFYVDVLGMEDGDRPDFDFPGNWLYVGEKPVVHLIGIDPDKPEGLEEYLGGNVDPQSHNSGSSAFDHVAFRAEDPSILITRLNDQATTTANARCLIWTSIRSSWKTPTASRSS